MVLCGFSAAHALGVVSRSFSATDSTIVAGNLVSTKSGDADSVELADSSNAERLAGIVVPSGQSLLAINATTSKLQVAINGTVDALVSSVGGHIQAGDQVGVSPFSGIGMKAGTNMRAVGIAQASFSDTTSGATAETVHDKTGTAWHIHVGRIPVTILIGTTLSSSPSQQNPLAGLQNFASALVGHSVSLLQVIISSLVAITALVALISLIYSAIQAGVTSIGRNPLARDSIYRSLIQVLIMTAAVAVVAVAVVWWILR